MLDNVFKVDQLRGIARVKSSDSVTKTIQPPMLEKAQQDGWSVLKRNKHSIRLVKRKPHGTNFEDRVWTLLYRMGFAHLSGSGGGLLTVNPGDDTSPISQIDVVAVDDETALAIECKSSEAFVTRPQFQDELGKHALVRSRFQQAVGKQLLADQKRQVALLMFLSQIRLSENDRKRAKEANVSIFDDVDLAYYEQLVSHIGPAARYQFLADVLPGKKVPGLALRVPAVQTKMGGVNCYTFSVAPAYLLKIAFVSHRAKGRGSDVNTYQRMIRKSRLTAIRQYINNDGVFPTNIVISLEQKPRFDQIEQHGDSKSGRLGWLELRPTYKSAWIIDGQHRLFAYSGLERSETSSLAILAFENLSASRQADLFIDINAQQKKVKQSLLEELYAELHWNSDDPVIRTRAIVSKAVQSLSDDRDSPFYGRVLTADEKKTSTRCITLSSLYSSLNKGELFAFYPRKGGPVEYGPLWGGDDNEQTRVRICQVTNSWFGAIASHADDWWNLGSGDGGGIAMNDGVSTCIGVLRSVLEHLELSERLARLETGELVARLEPFSETLATSLASLSIEERRRFRDLRGVQGVTTRRRRCEQAIQAVIPSFAPTGLVEWMELEKRQTNDQAKRIIDNIEMTMQRTILEELRREFGTDDEQWWFDGVPIAVRKPAMLRYEEDGGKRGGKEFYLDLVDYQPILKQNWHQLGGLLGYADAGSGKEKQSAWINSVNEVRRIVSHASSGQSVTLEQLDLLERYDQWLVTRITAMDSQGAAVLVPDALVVS